MERKQIWRWLGALAAGALVASAVIQVIVDDDLPIERGAARSFGRAVGLFVFAGIIPLLWWGVSKFRAASASGPLKLWSILAMLFSLSGGYGMYLQSDRTAPAASPVVYRPAGCEFSVTFPGKPTITQLTVAEYGEVAEAVLAAGDSMLRANCISGDVREFRRRDVVIGQLQAYADQNGLQNTVYEHEPDGEWPMGKARGYKQIDGKWMTFEVRYHVGRTSIMSLTVGALSSDYPTSSIMKFLGSVAR